MLLESTVYQKKASIRKTHADSQFLRVQLHSPRARTLLGNTSYYESSNGCVSVRVLQVMNFGDYLITEVVPKGSNTQELTAIDIEKMSKSNVKVLAFKHCSVMADQLFVTGYYMENHKTIPVEILQVHDYGNICIAEVLLKADFQAQLQQI